MPSRLSKTSSSSEKFFSGELNVLNKKIDFVAGEASD